MFLKILIGIALIIYSAIALATPPTPDGIPISVAIVSPDGLGKLQKDFAIPIFISNVKKIPTTGKMEFKQLEHNSENALNIPSRKLIITKHQEIINIRPLVKKDGLYGFKGTIEIEESIADFTLFILKEGEYIYHGRSPREIIQFIIMNERGGKKLFLEKSKENPYDSDFNSEVEKRLSKYSEHRKISNPINQGQSAKFQVKWPTNKNQTKFLPLDGAQINIINKKNQQHTTSGTLNSLGEFNFTSPSNGFEYVIEICATHTKFRIIMESTQRILCIRPEPASVIEIKTTKTITTEEANAWSAFQAFQDLSSNVSSVFQSPEPKELLTVSINSSPSGNFDAPSKINISENQFHSWDLLAHEYGHYFSHHTKSIKLFGNYHDGKTNQYDLKYTSNGIDLTSQTYKNRQNSMSTSFTEGFATWFAVAYFKHSKYANTMDAVGNDRLDFENGTFIDLTKENSPFSAYGPDSETAIARFLWKLTDGIGVENIRATCKKYCRDRIQVSPSYIFSTIYANEINNIERFLVLFTQKYAGTYFHNYQTIYNADQQHLVADVGALAAEFGFAPHLNDVDYPTWKYQENSGIIENYKTPVTLRWSIKKTGSMPLENYAYFMGFTEGRTLMKIRMNIFSVPVSNQYIYQVPTNQWDWFYIYDKGNSPISLIVQPYSNAFYGNMIDVKRTFNMVYPTGYPATIVNGPWITDGRWGPYPYEIGCLAAATRSYGNVTLLREYVTGPHGNHRLFANSCETIDASGQTHITTSVQYATCPGVENPSIVGVNEIYPVPTCLYSPQPIPPFKSVQLKEIPALSIRSTVFLALLIFIILLSQTIYWRKSKP